MTGVKWSRFERAWPTRNQAMDEATWAGFAEHVYAERIKIWQNNRYQVHEHSPELVKLAGMGGAEGWPDLIWLSVRRRDRAILKDWRDMQRIKDEIVGPRHEALELYPSRKRIVDSSNQYHLWVLTVPDLCFPFGYRTRDVVLDPKEAQAVGAIQRGFDVEHLTIVQPED